MRRALRYALDQPSRVSKLVYLSGTGNWHSPFKQNFAARLGPSLPRLTFLKEHARTDAEDRELGVLQWSADFGDPAKAWATPNRWPTRGSRSTTSAPQRSAPN